jgi:hypothetical protein
VAVGNFHSYLVLSDINGRLVVVFCDSLTMWVVKLISYCYRHYTRYTMQLSACNVERSKYLQTADSNSLAVGFNPFNICILITPQICKVKIRIDAG